MASWYNYLGIFTADDYETFLSVCEINPSRNTKELIMELIAEQFESNRLSLMSHLMIFSAVRNGHLVSKGGKYNYAGPQTFSFVRFDEMSPSP